MNNMDRPKLPGSRELLKKSFELYKSRFWSCVAILVPPAVVSILFSAIFSVTFKPGESLPEFGFLFVIFLAALILVSLWSSIALILTIQAPEKMSFSAAYNGAIRNLGPYVWLAFLEGFIAMGAFILFVVPGILFTIWFSLAFFVLLQEGDRGMNALVKSREYVRGYTGAVLGRYIVMILALIVVAIVISLLFIWLPTEGVASDIVSQVITILLEPWAIAFAFLVYQSLKAIKADFVFQPAKSQKVKYFVVAILGYALIPLLLVGVILSSIR